MTTPPLSIIVRVSMRSSERVWEKKPEPVVSYNFVESVGRGCARGAVAGVTDVQGQTYMSVRFQSPEVTLLVTETPL